MEKLEVELINENKSERKLNENESERQYEFELALCDKEGNEKYKFTIELSDDDLVEIVGIIIYREEITRKALHRDLRRQIIGLISEKCKKIGKAVDYHGLLWYDNAAAGCIETSLSEWIEQYVYDSLNSIYRLNNEQLEEMKKFYNEEIDLNLVIKRKDKNYVSGSEILSAEEMKKIRISKEKEWINRRKNNGANSFKSNLKVDVSMHKEEQKDNKESINIPTDKEI